MRGCMLRAGRAAPWRARGGHGQDVLCHNLVEHLDRLGERVQVVAKGHEVGFHYGEGSVSAGPGAWTLRVGCRSRTGTQKGAEGDGQSAVANCWPFWRTRMRGSVIVRTGASVRVV